MSKTKRNILIGAGSILTVLVLVLVLPFLVPLESYRGPIEDAASKATGRAFRIQGPVRLMLYPRLGVRAKTVTLANMPGGRAALMADVGDIELSVKVLPLLTGRIALDKIVLDKPTIALEVDRDGNPNWKFGKETPKSKTKGSLTLPNSTEFAGIDITDGRVTYDDAKLNTHRAIDHVNVQIGITTADQPVTVHGDITYVDRKVTFDGRLATLKTFLGGDGLTTFALSADGELLTARVAGTLNQDGQTEGQFDFVTPSFRQLAAWLGEPLPSGGLNGLKLSSRIVNKDKVTRFEKLRVVLDGQTMTGGLTVDARGKIPALAGDLAVDKLNLNPYLSTGKTGAAGGHPAAKPDKGWSKAPISVALLKTFDAKLNLSTGSLTVQSLHLGRTGLHLDNKGGVMSASLDPVSLYGGSGTAQLIVDARGKVPSFANKLDFRGVQLRPFLTDALSLSSIEGTGAVTLDIRSSGGSVNAILHGLSGKGSITAANGRLRGVDLGAVARSVEIALGGDATGEVAATDFHAMGATFVIAKGVLSTSDFHLAGPVIQASGSGNIDLGNRSIDFHIKPSAAAAGFSLGVPFKINGSWDKLHYAPDMAAIVGGVVDSLKNGGTALQNLFQGKDKNGKKKNVGDSLKDMFGIH